MRPAGLRVLVAVVVALLIALAFWLHGPASKPNVIEPAMAPEPTGTRTAGLAPVPAPRATAAAPAATGLADPTILLVEDGAHAQGQFEFDVTFAPVDELGRVLAGVRVEFALEGHRANCMGFSDSKGELRVTWRGDLATIRGSVSATDERGTSCTNDVVIASDAPHRVQFRAQNFSKITNAYSWKVAAEPPDGHPELRVRDQLFFAPPFETDAAGNGLFTDPDLMALSDPGSQPYKTEPLKHSFPLRLGRRASDRSGHARIECFVHDTSGRPIAYRAPWRTFGGAGHGGNAATTDRGGRFTYISRELGPVELEVGGGTFTTQRKKFDLDEDGSVQSWDIELSELPSVRGRLVGEDGNELGSWLVQAREDHPPFGFLQACKTDGGGNFTIGLSGNDTIRLLVNTPDEIERPAILLAEHQAANEKKADFVLTDSKLVKSVSWQIELPVTAMGRLPEARVVQRNSLEGVVLTPSAGSRTPSGMWGWSFRFDRALAGPYAITCSIPGARSVFEAEVLDATSDLGPQPQPGMVRIAVPDGAVDPKDQLTIRALEMSQGVRVRSETLPFPGAYFVPAGDVELWIVGKTTEGRPVKLRRGISKQDGERVVLALDELHHPAQTQAPAAAQR